MNDDGAERRNIYGLSREGLRLELGSRLGPSYHVAQLFRSVYRHPGRGIDGCTGLPKAVRESLSARYRIALPTIRRVTASADGTTKYLLELPAGGEVEAVAIPGEPRITFCVSSQIGCAFGCAFCMTARLGLVRHLEAGEIVSQIALLADATCTAEGRYNVVFMGMGEPLHNYDHVVAAIRLLTDKDAFALGPRRITVSTVGLAKGIRRLAGEDVAPRLAVSLVCADAAVRESLMPAARAFSLEDLSAAIHEFGSGKRDRPTLEVVMLRGVNDAAPHARALAEFARKAGAKVNLIEFNETPELPFKASPEDAIQRFMQALCAAGVTGTVRRSRGRDAEAACGQLAFTQRSNPSADG